MALKRRSLKADVMWLKIPLTGFVLAIAMTTGFYFFSAYYWNSVLRNESTIYNDFNYVSSQVFAIEEAEQIIIDNIDRFNEMTSHQVMDEEDRVGLLAEIGEIRDKYKLFPITVSVSEQERMVLPYPDDVESPEEQVSLRKSILQVQLPLLHEEDLTRFLYDFIQPTRLLVNNRCVVSDLLVSDQDILNVVPHQQANCEFHWFTLRREPFVFEDILYE